MVAMTARDTIHERDLWLGDLRTGSIQVAYTAPESPGKKAEIWWPQMADGQLLWIEYVHVGADVGTPIHDWSVKKMDLATRHVSVVAHGLMPAYGGTQYVDRIRFDGQRLGFAEALADKSWRIQVFDSAGRLQNTIPVDRSFFEFALAPDGVLYVSGTNDYAIDAVGKTHLVQWTRSGGAVEVAQDAFELCSDGSVAAWIEDPAASQGTTGNPQQPRMFASSGNPARGVAISPVDDGNPTTGVVYPACGSGGVAWWEHEWTTYMNATDSVDRGVLTYWRPGWTAPIQIRTADYDGIISIRGGWLVWTELGSETERIRGMPLSALPTGPS